MNGGAPLFEKSLEGFKNLKEIKSGDILIIINLGKNSAKDKIVGIIMRRELKNFTPKLKDKYK